MLQPTDIKNDNVSIRNRGGSKNIGILLGFSFIFWGPWSLSGTIFQSSQELLVFLGGKRPRTERGSLVETADCAFPV